MARLNKDREEVLQPRRVLNSIFKIRKKGYEINRIDKTTISFQFKGSTILFYPYSGWHTGKTIKDGRGLKNLLNQI